MGAIEKKLDPRGAIIVTCPYDWLFAKGTIASIRYFMPDLPICLLIDGEVDTEEAEEAYGVSVMKKADIPDPWLRKNSFGWGFTKMNAIWHSPYSRFLHLDADTVIWGDLTAKVFPEDIDVSWPMGTDPGVSKAAEYMDTWFFNPARVENLYPEFEWKKYISKYACTGAYSLRINGLELEAYKRMISLGAKYPELFKFAGEMGMLNLMLFLKNDAQELKMKHSDFQVIFPDHSIENLEDRFKIEGGKPVVIEGDEQVLHMPDQKPLLDNDVCYSAPMTYFRMLYLRNTRGLKGEVAMDCLRQEDKEYHQLRLLFLKKEKRAKIIRLLRCHPGEWRKACTKLFKR